MNKELVEIGCRCPNPKCNATKEDIKVANPRAMFIFMAYVCTKCNATWKRDYNGWKIRVEEPQVEVQKKPKESYTTLDIILVTITMGIIFIVSIYLGILYGKTL